MFSARLQEKQQLSSSINTSELHQHVVAAINITTSATRASRQLTAVAQKMACQH
jgi:hypothetical protein